MNALSERDQRFCEGIVYGESASITASYRETRDTLANAKNVRAEASRLWRSDRVQAYAGELRRELLNRARARAEGDRERIRLALWTEASAADRSSDRLRALQLLGLTVNLFSEVKQESIVGGEAHSAAEIASQIEAMLLELAPEVEPDPEEATHPPTPLLPERASSNSKHQSEQTITNSDGIVIQLHPKSATTIDISPQGPKKAKKAKKKECCGERETLGQCCGKVILPGMDPLKF